jgi:hypothetical protein
MTQQYQIALDPQLGLTPETFVAAWNEREAALAAGRIGISQRQRSMFDPGTAALILTTATGIVASVLASLIYDIIKEKLLPQKEPEVTLKKLSDGREVIVVTIRES